jgi:membrane dipeptidase
MSSVHASSSSSHPYQNLAIDERVTHILRNTPLFDGHNDLPQQPRAVTHGKIYNQEKFDFEKGFERGMTDIPRLRQGGLKPLSCLSM